VVRKNQGGAYILRELDGTLFRNTPTAAFRLLPYITRSHWFMQENGLEEEENSETDSEEEELFESSDEE
jgi:hypothetical protein